MIPEDLTRSLKTFLRSLSPQHMQELLPALTWTPMGCGKKGCPRTTWRRMILEEMRSAGICWESAAGFAQDKAI